MLPGSVHDVHLLPGAEHRARFFETAVRQPIGIERLGKPDESSDEERPDFHPVSSHGKMLRFDEEFI